MDTISVKGKSFVKSTDIARELGYTTDYVGQLCRGEKVEAKLVGRSWYVNPDSIKEHKKNRYRSVAAKSKAQIKDTIEKKTTEVPVKTNPFDRPNWPKYTNTSIKYEVDENDLLPNTAAVKSANEERVEIKKEVAEEQLEEVAKLDIEEVEQDVSPVSISKQSSPVINQSALPKKTVSMDRSMVPKPSPKYINNDLSEASLKNEQQKSKNKQARSSIKISRVVGIGVLGLSFIFTMSCLFVVQTWQWQKDGEGAGVNYQINADTLLNLFKK